MVKKFPATVLDLIDSLRSILITMGRAFGLCCGAGVTMVMLAMGISSPASAKRFSFEGFQKIPELAASVEDPRGMLKAICQIPDVKTLIAYPDHASKVDRKKLAAGARSYAREQLMLEMWKRMHKAEKGLLPFLSADARIGLVHNKQCRALSKVAGFDDLLTSQQREVNRLKPYWKVFRNIDLFGLGKDRAGIGGRVYNLTREALYVSMIRYGLEDGGMFAKPLWNSKTFISAAKNLVQKVKPEQEEEFKVVSRAFLASFLSKDNDGLAYTPPGRRRLSQSRYPILARPGLRSLGVAQRDLAEMLVWDGFLQKDNPRLGVVSDKKMRKLVSDLLLPLFKQRFAEALALPQEKVASLAQSSLFNFNQKFVAQKASSHDKIKRKPISDLEWRYHYAWGLVLALDFDSLVEDKVIELSRGSEGMKRSLPRIEQTAYEWMQNISDTRSKTCERADLQYVEQLTDLPILALNDQPIKTLDQNLMRGLCDEDFTRTERIQGEATATGLSLVGLLAGMSVLPDRTLFTMTKSQSMRKKIGTGLLIGSSISSAASEVSRGFRYKDQLLTSLAFTSPDMSKRNFENVGSATHFVMAAISAGFISYAGINILSPERKGVPLSMWNLGKGKFGKTLASREVTRIAQEQGISKAKALKTLIERVEDKSHYAMPAFKRAQEVYTRNNSFDEAYAVFINSNRELVDDLLYLKNIRHYMSSVKGAGESVLVGGVKYLIPPIPGVKFTEGTYSQGEMVLYWIRALFAQVITATKWLDQDVNPLTNKFFYLDSFSVLLDAGLFAKLAGNISPEWHGSLQLMGILTAFNTSLDYYFQNAVFSMTGNQVSLRNREAVKYFSMLQGGMRTAFLQGRTALPFAMSTLSKGNVNVQTVTQFLTLFDMTYFYFRSHFVNQVYIDFLNNYDKTFGDALTDIRWEHVGIPIPKDRLTPAFEEDSISLFANSLEGNDGIKLSQQEFNAGLQILASQLTKEDAEVLKVHLQERLKYLEAFSRSMKDLVK